MAPPLHLIVLVKGVPDIQIERHLDAQLRLQRPEGVLSELDEYPLEAALQLREAYGAQRDVVLSAVTMGPQNATTALRKALQMGADEAFHLNDDALAGADIWATARALSAAIAEVITRGAQTRGAEAEVLVLSGMVSEDGETSAVPAAMAEHLQLNFFSHVVSLELQDADNQETPGNQEALGDHYAPGDLEPGDPGTSDATSLHLRATRINGVEHQQASFGLPALVTVTDQANTPRYPNFKAIMAAKKKPITTLNAAELGLSGDDLTPKVQVLEAQQRPERASGTVITDDGTAGTQLVDFLQKEHLV